MRFDRRLIIPGVLCAAALAQVAVLSLRPAEPIPPPVFSLSTGDTVVHLNGSNPDGSPASIRWGSADGRWTALLAFHSECAFCDMVAEDWQAWLQRGPSVQVVAITGELPDVGAAYARAHDWNVRVVSLNGLRESPTQAALLHRTPWIFLISPEGVIHFEAHGANLVSLDSIITGLDRPRTAITNDIS
jgi:hypothetical protein